MAPNQLFDLLVLIDNAEIIKAVGRISELWFECAGYRLRIA